MTTFSAVTQVGRSVFLGVSYIARPKERACSVLTIFEMRAHSVRNSKQILRGDQSR